MLTHFSTMSPARAFSATYPNLLFWLSSLLLCNPYKQVLEITLPTFILVLVSHSAMA